MEQKRRLRIIAKKWETEDTATFSLEPVDGLPLHYRPGQYLSLIFASFGREKRRAYSFSTCPGVDPFPAITVKRVVNGEFSNRLLSHYDAGDELLCTDPYGRFLLPENPAGALFYIAAGGGITPVMSHLKALLVSPRQPGSETARIVLYYANRDSRSTIFKEQIDRWMSEYPERFECLYFFSREKNTDHALYRHLNNELLEQLLLTRSGGRLSARERLNTRFFLCAPKAMMRMAEMTLRTLDFPAENIIRETFEAEKNLPVRQADTSQTHTVVATGKGERIEFQTFEGETILNAALRQGIDLPYTCKSGVCFTCLARCLAGTVDVAFAETTQREGPGDMVNTCIGYAVSDRVEIFYE